MNTDKNETLEQRRRRFWERFAQFLLSQAIAPKARPWYLNHARSFVDEVGVPLRQVDPKLLDDFFAELGRQELVSGWQCSQKVHAISLLFRNFVMPPWADSYPWEERMDAFRELEPDHITFARRESLSPKFSREAKEISATALTSQQTENISKFVRTMRTEGKAARTEQTYREWIERWMRHRNWLHKKAGNSDQALDDPTPENINESIRLFLEHLAVERGVAKSTQTRR